MKKKHAIINIMTFGLPYKLANQIYREHGDRLNEAKYIIDLSDNYKDLKKDLKTVDALLALSIFHKRVIMCLDGADKFYGTITKISGADTIAIGRYKLTLSERNKILGLLINYRQMIKKFNIPENLMDYDLTKDFLKKLLTLKYSPSVKTTDQNKEDFNKNDQIGSYDDLPF